MSRWAWSLFAAVLAAACTPLTPEPGTIAVTDLAETCAVTLARRCRVESSGPVDGRPSWPRLYEQVLVDAELGGYRGSVVLEPVGQDHARVLFSNIGEAVWGVGVNLIPSPAGLLLVMHATNKGTAHEDASLVHLRTTEGGWRPIDIRTWTAGVQPLPDGRRASRGWVYDWARLQTFTPLYRPEDGGCCPTGGVLRATLRLENDVLELVSLDEVSGGSPPVI